MVTQLQPARGFSGNYMIHAEQYIQKDNTVYSHKSKLDNSIHIDDFGCSINLLIAIDKWIQSLHIWMCLCSTHAVTFYRNSCLPKQRHAGAGTSFHTRAQLARSASSTYSTVSLQKRAVFSFYSFCLVFLHSVFYVTYFLCFLSKYNCCYICIYIAFTIKTLFINMNLRSSASKLWEKCSLASMKELLIQLSTIKCQLVWWNIVQLCTGLLMPETFLILMHCFVVSLCFTNK